MSSSHDVNFDMTILLGVNKKFPLNELRIKREQMKNTHNSVIYGKGENKGYKETKINRILSEKNGPYVCMYA